MPNCGKEIQNLAVVCRRIANSIRREHWQLQRMGNANRSLIAPLLLAFPMTLQFDIDILAAEDVNQPFDGLASGFFASAHQCSGQWTFISSGQADQAGSILLKIIEGGGAFLLSWSHAS